MLVQHDPESSASVSLDDKYLVDPGWVVLSGIQALVRLPLLRRELDLKAGLNTAGFISGYRGSPLGSYDQQLWRAQRLLAQQQIVFKPAINEELAATAVWGTQQVNNYPGAHCDGVFALWYGKGPGVDRSGDVFKHANFFGTSRYGGVLALAGDDHGAKSSTMPNQSEFAFMDAEMPVLNPANVEEVLEFGVKGLALSRFSGLWVGMKTIADTMDSTATVYVNSDRYATAVDTWPGAPAEGLHARLTDTPAAQEQRHRHFRLPAAQAFARGNGLDRIEIDSPRARWGILTGGKAYLHVRQALLDAGISDDRARELGIRLLKVGLSWPLDPVVARSFADGLEEVVVVEERRDLLEHQLKALVYDLPDGRRPRIVGKRDETGRPLIPDLADLDTATVAITLLRRFPEQWRGEDMQRHLERLSARMRTAESEGPVHVRSPFFCSGCPHNASTKVPEGSRALAGIGCHFLVQWMDRRSESCTQMGGEGVPWMGQAPFTEEPHIFANLGDGTYFHSGSLAIRQAVAAGLNITYKLLFNGAVAMTGGQGVDGELSVPAMVSQLKSEGVSRIALVTEDVARYRDASLPSSVTVHHRDELNAVQTQLRDSPGCSVLIYDQMCATEARQKRKRGALQAPPQRALINERVCEGCGDCSVQSNCLSVVPVETEFGSKRRIEQHSCNQDLSCLKGFCPSFVSVSGGTLRRGGTDERRRVTLPEPSLPSLDTAPFNILLAGIGGQGVTTLSAVIAMAAHLESRNVRIVDQLGMAQKGGGVHSHVRIGDRTQPIFSPRIGPGEADLVLAADLVVAHGKAVLPACSPERTHVLSDSHVAPTAEFVMDNDVRLDRSAMLEVLRGHSRTLTEIPATERATRSIGDPVYANVFLLGHAYQRGLVPVAAPALERSIELNGAAVEENLAAFRSGRESAVERESAHPPVPQSGQVATSLRDVVAIRVRELIAYAGEGYAEEYRSFVQWVRAGERRALPEKNDLALVS